MAGRLFHSDLGLQSNFDQLQSAGTHFINVCSHCKIKSKKEVKMSEVEGENNAVRATTLHKQNHCLRVEGK